MAITPRFATASQQLPGIIDGRVGNRSAGNNIDLVVIGNSIGRGNSQSGNTLQPQGALITVAPELAQATGYNYCVAGCVLDSTVYGSAASANDTVRQYANSARALRPALTGRRAILYIHTIENDPPNMTPVGPPDATNTAYIAYVAALSALCDLARSEGFEVIVDTAIIRQDTPAIAFQPGILNLTYLINEYIRNMKNVDGVADIAQILPDPTNATYFRGDLVHPNDAGTTVMARAWRTVFKSLGLRSPLATTVTAPAAWYTSPISVAGSGFLNSIAIEGANDGLSSHDLATLSSALPAVGTSDYAFSGWVYVPAGATQISMLASATGALGDWGLIGNGNGYLTAYCSPAVTPAVRFHDVVKADGRWVHCLWSRASGVVTFYLNGVQADIPYTHNTDVGTPSKMNILNGSRYARFRFYNAAKTAAQVAAEYAAMSAYSASDTTCIYAMGDGDQYRGQSIGERTSNGRTLLMVGNGVASARIMKPLSRSFKKGTVSAGTILTQMWAVGDILTSIKLKTSAGAAGLVDLGFTNGSGDIYRATPGINARVDAPTEGTVTTSTSMYVNISGGGSLDYLIEFSAP